jgi:large subunit ribosomal protein L19
MAITLSTLDKNTRKTLDLRTGDTVKVHQKIQEKNKTRIQIFEGMILARKHGTEAGATLTVRRSANGYGVEKIFPLYSPMIDKIELVKRSKVRRAKLYYIRDKAVKEINKRLKMQMVRGDKAPVAAAPDNDLLDETPDDVDMAEVAEIENSSK